ncbi:LysR family transcriptional regulator [Lacimonas salitolerans]|uniref:LysR family transcriptional regulator n=1 Tax=Lacimonas salitolerans TaxID=1323750 RepID=A0ABW4EI73_9RHOB
MEWIEDLVAIFESESLNEAAGRRHLTQPAFTRRVRSIEDYIGVELIDRSRKPARPATTLVEQETRLRTMAQELRALVLDLRKSERHSRSRVVIGSQHAITTSILPTLIADKFDGLDITIRLRSANRSECTAMLITKEADLIVIFRSVEEISTIPEEYIEEKLISQEKLIPVCSAKVRRAIANGDLPIVAYPSDVFLGKLLETHILPSIQESFRIDARVETALTVAALQLAACDIGVAWVPETMLAQLPTASTVTAVDDLLPSTQIAVTAMRLIGKKSNVEDQVWAAIRDLRQ